MTARGPWMHGHGVRTGRTMATGRRSVTKVGKLLAGPRLYAADMRRLPATPPPFRDRPDRGPSAREPEPAHVMVADARHREISVTAWLALVAGGALCWSMILSAL